MFVLHSGGDSLNCNKSWCKLFLGSLVSLYIFKHVLRFSKNPEDSPGSSPQKALALAYDGDLDMWVHHAYAMLKADVWHHSGHSMNFHKLSMTTSQTRDGVWLENWCLNSTKTKREAVGRTWKMSYSRNRMWHHVYSTIAWVCVCLSVWRSVCVCVNQGLFNAHYEEIVLYILKELFTHKRFFFSRAHVIPNPY